MKIDIGPVNIEFHNILARATKNPVLILNMRLLMDLTMQFARHAAPDVDPYHIEWRRKMVALLRARDEEAAVAAMHERLQRLRERYHKLAEQQAQNGETAFGRLLAAR